MHRLLKLAALFVCFSFGLAVAAHTEGGAKPPLNSAKLDLRNAYVKCVAHSCGLIANHPVDFLLMRENFEKPVAVIRIEKNGSVILNPPGYSYKRIPDLALITPTQASQLWSSTGLEAGPNSNPSYHLKNFRGELFTIDLLFKNKRLIKYRIRSNHYLQKKELWFSTSSKK